MAPNPALGRPSKTTRRIACLVGFENDWNFFRGDTWHENSLAVG